MNNLERLYNNLKVLIDTGAFEEEFKVFISENSDLNSISELNEIIETEISCWEA